MPVERIVTGASEREINGPFKPPIWDGISNGSRNGQQAYDNTGAIDGTAGPIYWNGSIWVKIGTGSGIIVVDNLAAMKALPLSRLNKNSPVELLGRSSVNDGYGGVYYWLSAVVLTADDNDIIQVTATSTGRFIRFQSNGPTPSDLDFDL